MFSKNATVGVAGSGAMGSGIAQVAAQAGYQVLIFDTDKSALNRASSAIGASLAKLTEKQKITAIQATEIQSRCRFTDNISELADCALIIEAIIENPEIKKQLFSQLETITRGKAVLASNTSSLSITALASACSAPQQVVGIHFFNPATILPLVEIVPGIATSPEVVENCRNLVAAWGKTPVIAKDTPGFIVNRVARPFYGEALRILDEGIADTATIDWAVKHKGGFKMGPFELMDLIGHDVNYVVTETVWKELYYDPRFKPSLTQKRLLDAGFLGQKKGRGFYDYTPGTQRPQPVADDDLAEKVFSRILCMLINEAADAVCLRIASRDDIDLAMTKGVNYPKGLLKWADEIGIHNVVHQIDLYRELYQEDRYRVSPLLRKMVRDKTTFYPG